MPRIRSLVWSVLLCALTVALVGTVGCGDSGSRSDGTALSADQILARSQTKMAEVTSAAFVDDLKVTTEGDASAMNDAIAQAMLSDGLTVHAEGNCTVDPRTVDADISMGLAGQTIAFGVLAEGDQAWVQYEDAWYKLDAEDMKGLGLETSASPASANQLEGLGLGMSAWGTAYELLGTEDLDGTKVYHIAGTIDPQKLADSLVSAAASPDATWELSDDTAAAEIAGELKKSKKQVEQLKKALTDATIDYWIGVDDQLMYKIEMAASLDTSDLEGAEGLTGAKLKASIALSDFDEPVEVTPPAQAKPIDELMNQLFGGMLSTET